MTNKFAFFFPAKIAFAESNVELTPLEFSGKTFYLGPLGKNIYFSCDKGRIVVSQNGADMIQIFVKVGEHFCNMTNTPETNVTTWLENKIDSINELLPKWENQVNNPELYEQEATKTREKIKAEREIADKEYEQRKLERAQAAQTAYENALTSFLGGEKISWDYFERAIKENGVNLPIKTIGFGRKHITGIALNTMSTTGKHNSPVLWEAVRNLKEKLAPKEII